MFSQGERFSSHLEVVTFQEKKLREQLVYLAGHSPFYAELFAKNSIDIQTIKSLKNLDKLPVTEKEHLQTQNDKFLCVPKEKIVEYVTTSGTLGEPVVFALTENDLERLAYNEYLSFQQAGITPKDIIQLTVTSDRCFMAGNAYTLGARRLGAALIRTGPGLPEFQWSTILRLQPTVIIAVPSFLLKLIDYAEKNGIDYRTTSIKKAICVGEPLRAEDLSDNVLALKIHQKWPIELYSTYASTEMSTAFTECSVRKGGHLSPELIITECLDASNQPVQTGEIGEISITTLGIEAMPLLRFKTGDMARVLEEPCTCGNPSHRIGPIVGRKKHMIKYKGTTFYPDAIKQTLLHLPNVEDFYSEVTTNDIGMDELTLHVCLAHPSAEAEKQVKDAFRSHLRVIPTILFEGKAQVVAIKNNPSFRKPIDFIDKRQFTTAH